jgi:hypothetical protein
MSPPFSGLRSMTSKKPARSLLHADFLIGLPFSHENGSDMFLGNVE